MGVTAERFYELPPTLPLFKEYTYGLSLSIDNHISLFIYSS